MVLRLSNLHVLVDLWIFDISEGYCQTLYMRHKQQRFAIEYCVDFNATQAAIRAGYSPDSAHAQGCDLLKLPEVLKMVEDRKADLAAAAGITPDWILRKWREIVEEDPNDLMETRNKPCSQCWPAGLEYDEPNVACGLCMGQGRVVTIFKNSRGRKLFAGVKKTKDGLEIKTRDQDAALKNLSAYLGMSLERREVSVRASVSLRADDMSDDELAAIATGQSLPQ
jgi:phage terminase small subunit